MTITNNNNYSIAKKAGLGAIVGATLGLPQIIEGTKGLKKINITDKQVTETLIRQNKTSDTFKKIKGEKIISTSKKRIQEFCDNINKAEGLMNFGKEGIDILQKGKKTFESLKKAYKKDIKVGLALSAVGALIGAGLIILTNKVKKEKV